MKDLDNLVGLIDAPVAAPVSDSSSAIQSLGKSVLIVDDDSDTRWLLTHLLVKAGYEVQTAESAEGAMRVLFSFAPDAVLMDVRLPGMNGLELVRLIKLTTPKKVPILAVSAGNGEFAIQEAYEAGCDGYIAKPVDNNTFVVTVGQYL
jgi:CheY-like chemotaxis protein